MRRSSRGLVRALQRQSKDRTCGNRLLRVLKKASWDRARCDDRVAPVVEAHKLREQLRAEAVSVAADAIDGEMRLRAHAMRLGCEGSARQCGGWIANSSANTSSAERKSISAPSGCLHAPRPETSCDHRCRRARSSVFDPRSPILAVASARARRPKKQGPH